MQQFGGFCCFDFVIRLIFSGSVCAGSVALECVEEHLHGCGCGLVDDLAAVAVEVKHAGVADRRGLDRHPHCAYRFVGGASAGAGYADVATAQSAPIAWRAPEAISATVGCDTAPWFCRVESLTPSSRHLTSLL